MTTGDSVLDSEEDLLKMNAALYIMLIYYTVKCRCNERQYNEMFRIAKLCLGPFPFPYLMCVKTFHFNEFRTFSITN